MSRGNRQKKHKKKKAARVTHDSAPRTPSPLGVMGTSATEPCAPLQLGQGETTILVRPHDVLFFRGGRPFTAGESHFADGVRVPWPSTVYGALRTGLAISMGADFEAFKTGSSSPATQLLGTSSEPGSLRARGPFLAVRTPTTDWQPMFATPNDLEMIADDGEDRLYRTRYPEAGEWFCSGTGSGPSSVPTLPVAPSIFDTNPAGGFLTGDLLGDYLAGTWPPPGGVPTRTLPAHKLLARESRAGIVRDSATRTVEEGKLYAISFLRLPAERDFEVALEFLVEAGSRTIAPGDDSSGLGDATGKAFDREVCGGEESRVEASEKDEAKDEASRVEASQEDDSEDETSQVEASQEGDSDDEALRVEASQEDDAEDETPGSEESGEESFQAEVPSILLLGGEGRCVDCTRVASMVLPAFPGVPVECSGFLLYLATPGLWAQGWLPGWIDRVTLAVDPKAPVPPSRLMGLATEPAVTFSGWDMAENRPRGTSLAVPAGAVYRFGWCAPSGPTSDDIKKLESIHGRALADGLPGADRMGWGVVLVGFWR